VFQGLTPQDIAAAARLRSQHRFQSNIPSRRNIPVVGRDNLLDRMLDRLGDTAIDNVIILHGPPGVGKSELEHFSIRLGVSRVREISVAFFFGNTFEK
jgi:replication-associated recombination protein RarA